MSLTIIQRSDWGARPRNGTPERRSPSSIDTLVVHWPGHTGSLKHINTTAEEKAQLRAWQDFHIDGNGWIDLGYNHVIFPNWGRPGQAPHVYTGRGARYTPAAQANNNRGTLAVMVAIGTEDGVNPATKRRLRSYVRWAEEYVGHELRVVGHRHFGGTSCPGDKLNRYTRRMDRV